MGQSPSSDSYNTEGEGMPFFQGKSDFGKVNPKIRMYCKSPKKLAHKNDILLSVRAPVGDVNIAEEHVALDVDWRRYQVKKRKVIRNIYIIIYFGKRKS